jgi:hypothetical protein
MGVKISNLPAITAPALSDIFPVVQSGVTYKETFTQLGSLFATSGANSNITSLTGITGIIKAPTFIDDINSNHIMKFSSVGSAVNYLDFQNAQTGNSPVVAAAGTDSDVNLRISGKGSGFVQLYTGLTNTTTGFQVLNGTNNQHITTFSMSNTNASRTVTISDMNGTMFLSSKANGTEAANAVTASGTSGVITTSGLTTAGGASYAITWTNTFITTSSIIQLTIMGGTNTTQNVTLTATAGSGTSTLTIYNNTAATALNGTILIGYIVIP